MSNEKMTQKEYLRKYLNSGEDGKKKKKKKPKLGSKTVKIIDDDVDLKNMRPIQDGEFDILNAYAEDAPQIVGVVDERGPVDFTDKRRWRIIAEDEDGNVAVSTNENAHRDLEHENIDSSEFVHSLKQSKKSGKGQKSEDRDVSPPRKRKDYSKDNLSPLRNSRREQSNWRASKTLDETPPRRKSKPTSKKSKKQRKDSTSESRSSSSPSSSENDASPPRRSKNQEDGVKKSQKGKRGPKSRAEDSDLSPPRETKKRRTFEMRVGGSSGRGRDEQIGDREDFDGDQSLPRKLRYEDAKKKSYNGKRAPISRAEDSDRSPPRKSKKRPDFETRIDGNSGRQLNQEKRTRARRDSNSDLSPPRESKKTRDFDTSSNGNPERLGEKNSRSHRYSDSDQSPPRRSTKDQKSVEVRRGPGKQGGSDSDLSPPRRSANDYRSIDARRSTEKRGGSNSDLSPPRLSSKNQHYKDDARHLHAGRREDERNGRQRHRDKEGSDARSGPGGRSRRRSRSPRRKFRWDEERHRKSASPGSPRRDADKRMKKTLDGKTAGLQDARALRIETEAHKKREADLFNKMSAEVSGVGQAAVLRDRKTGRRRDLAAEATERREKEKRQEEIDEKYAKWGKGLKQVEEQEEKRARDQYEMSKPLARYADDADLDMCRKEELHAEDPMMEEIMERQIKEGTRKPERPSYQGSHMPNRFGIKPGHRWDGVDRSNGYEKRWFEARNARAAVQEEAYKWSTADM